MKDTSVCKFCNNSAQAERLGLAPGTAERREANRLTPKLIRQRSADEDGSTPEDCKRSSGRLQRLVLHHKLRHGAED
jgi:hypothetical protein